MLTEQVSFSCHKDITNVGEFTAIQIQIGSRSSVCPSIRLSHAWIVTNVNHALQIF